MKKILFAALATIALATAAACGPNWGFVCVGDNCPGSGGVDQPSDPDSGCPIDDPTDPGDGGGPTDPGDGGGPTDPGDGGSDPGDGGSDPGDGGSDPGDGGSDPGDGGTTPGDGGSDPGDGGTDKTCICHVPRGKPSNAHTICIGEPALSAHLAHGDSPYPCNW